MDLQKMLKRCRKEQWSLDALDWSRTPASMSRDKEEAIVQYFTDMAGIERLAGALFREQARLSDDPVLIEIFNSFVIDEERHAQAGERLAAFYDVHKYRTYEMNPHLLKFTPNFLNLMQFLNPEIANAYITSGELILDIALIRSLNDHVDDTMCREVMDLINRDESRHIAIDYHMVEYYSSDAYAAQIKKRPRDRLLRRIRATLALVSMLFHARPFFREVFFQPMARVDPEGRRVNQAFKQIQLVASRPEVARIPFVRFMLTMQRGFNHPVIGRLLGPALIRILGADPEVLRPLYTESEARRAHAMDLSAMAMEALGLKSPA
jgi:hypothetical protein